MTPRGLALFFVARHPGCTKKELAAALRVTDRTVTNVLGDLVAAGVVRGVNGDGRRLHYEIEWNATVEMPEGARVPLKSVLGHVAD
jgi:hypothetical protein